jgi:hypothetical protein
MCKRNWAGLQKRFEQILHTSGRPVWIFMWVFRTLDWAKPCEYHVSFFLSYKASEHYLAAYVTLVGPLPRVGSLVHDHLIPSSRPFITVGTLVRGFPCVGSHVQAQS